jgi:CHAT domain-containing protein
MYAGARSLLVSHWSVESQAARELMVETINGMLVYKKAEALRKAKLRIKKTYWESPGTPNGKLSLSHPFFWSPFVLVGD